MVALVSTLKLVVGGASSSFLTRMCGRSICNRHLDPDFCLTGILITKSLGRPFGKLRVKKEWLGLAEAKSLPTWGKVWMGAFMNHELISAF